MQLFIPRILHHKCTAVFTLKVKTEAKLSLRVCGGGKGHHTLRDRCEAYCSQQCTAGGSLLLS